MTNINVKDFKDLFLETAGGHVQVLSDNLSDASKLEELHRSAHSLKGQSLAIGYIATGKLSLILEKFFRKVMDEKLEITDEQITVLREVVTKLRESLETIRIENKEADIAAYADEVKGKLGVHIE